MNEININLGAWNNVFAVPGDVVDKHIKIAKEAQLKVLLYILRNSGRAISIDMIADFLLIHPTEVKDSVDFWVSAGLLNKNNNELLPAAPKKTDVTINSVNTEASNKTNNTAQKTENSFNNNYTSSKNFSYSTNTAVTKESDKPINATPARTPARAVRPDSIFVAQRINGDTNLASLMEEAQVILGRPLSHGDSSTLLMLHDNDGLPVDVILMILQFAVSENKGMRYVEKMGINWASENIDTLEKADIKITEIMQTKDAWSKAAKVFGISLAGTPTKKQLECSNRWINDWKYSDEMLREAYETCVNTKGEYNLSYIDGIIKKWNKNGILSIDDLNASKQKTANKTSAATSNTSYDLNAYENFSIFDKED